jgi:hypothetical protein
MELKKWTGFSEFMIKLEKNSKEKEKNRPVTVFDSIYCFENTVYIHIYIMMSCSSNKIDQSIVDSKKINPRYRK